MAWSATSSVVGGYTWPPALEQPSRLRHCGREIPEHVGQRRDHEVPDRVAGQRAASEPMLVEAGHLGVVRQCNQAVTDVAGRWYPELARQPARRPSVVGHRYNGSNRVRIQTSRQQAFGQAVSAPDPHYLH